MVNDLFEEQTDLEKIVRKIMQRALTLLQCERCSVLLLEDINSPVRTAGSSSPSHTSVCLNFSTESSRPLLSKAWAASAALLVMMSVPHTGGEVLKDVRAHVPIVQHGP